MSACPPRTGALRLSRSSRPMTASRVSVLSRAGYGSGVIAASIAKTSGDIPVALRGQIDGCQRTRRLDAAEDLARRFEMDRPLRIIRVEMTTDLVVGQALLVGHVKLRCAPQRPAPQAQGATSATREPRAASFEDGPARTSHRKDASEALHP